MPCASIALLSLDIFSFLCFDPYWWGVDLDPVVQIYIHTPRPISKGLDHFLMCMCMFTCFYTLCLCLPLKSRLCHALCPLWACLCVVTSIPLVAYWSVTTYETHPSDAGLLDAYPFSTPCNVACHACFVPPVSLSMHSFCTLAYMFMHDSLLVCVVHTLI